MGVQAVPQILPPVRAGDRAGFAGTAFEPSRAGDFAGRVGEGRDARRAASVDEREARQGRHRSVGSEEHTTRSAWGRRAYDRRDGYSFQLTLDPKEPHVRHSTPFVAQLLDQADATLTQPREGWTMRAAAYDASNARAEAVYGVIESIEVLA
ncbi:MAG: hypothetical protein FJX65_01690 [Alphaproteobacteria bacterium]|nr:hypothetical protein [Alphaproteobacteria bacterium]